MSISPLARLRPRCPMWINAQRSVWPPPEKITVKLVGKDLQKYHVRTRDGYRLQQVRASQEDSAQAGSGPVAK